MNSNVFLFVSRLLGVLTFLYIASELMVYLYQVNIFVDILILLYMTSGLTMFILIPLDIYISAWFRLGKKPKLYGQNIFTFPESMYMSFSHFNLNIYINTYLYYVIPIIFFLKPLIFYKYMSAFSKYNYLGAIERIKGEKAFKIDTIRFLTKRDFIYNYITSSLHSSQIHKILSKIDDDTLKMEIKGIVCKQEDIIAKEKVRYYFTWYILYEDDTLEKQYRVKIPNPKQKKESKIFDIENLNYTYNEDTNRSLLTLDSLGELTLIGKPELLTYKDTLFKTKEGIFYILGVVDKKDTLLMLKDGVFELYKFNRECSAEYEIEKYFKKEEDVIDYMMIINEFTKIYDLTHSKLSKDIQKTSV